MLDLFGDPIEEPKTRKGKATYQDTPVIRLRIVADYAVRTPAHLTSPAAVAEALQHWADLDRETLLAVLLNTKMQIIGIEQVAVGGTAQCASEIGIMFRAALVAGAASMIIAHNHPSGDPTPSPDDAAVTRTIVEAGKLLDVKVIDHIVLGHNGHFFSLKERGLLEKPT